MAGALAVCPTPIGNLDDVSPRIRETLISADFVACEVADAFCAAGAGGVAATAFGGGAASLLVSCTSIGLAGGLLPPEESTGPHSFGRSAIVMSCRCPAEILSCRSQRAAMAWSWVTITSVVPSSRLSSNISAITCSPVA